MENRVTSSINCAVDYYTTLLKSFIANNPPYHLKQSSAQKKQPQGMPLFVKKFSKGVFGNHY